MFWDSKDFAFTGVPYIISSTVELDCQNGKDKDKRKKEKYHAERERQAVSIAEFSRYQNA